MSHIGESSKLRISNTQRPRGREMKKGRTQRRSGLRDSRNRKYAGLQSQCD